MQKRFVFDVTTLLDWNRPPVGIVRTQLELGRWLLTRTEEIPVLFVRFTKDKAQIQAVDNQVVERLIFRLDNPAPDETPGEREASPLPIPRPGIKQKIKRFLKPIVLRVTPRSQHRNLGMAWRVYRHHGVIAVSSKIIRRLVGRTSPPPYMEDLYSLSPEGQEPLAQLVPPHMDLACFEGRFLARDDVFISVGLDWDSSNYPLMYWLKKRIGFQFVGAFYDAIPILHPEYVHSIYFPKVFFSHFYHLNYLADRVFCISDFSRSQYLSVTSAHGMGRAPRLQTIHLGDAIPTAEKQGVAHNRSLPRDYILYVSTIEARKNHRVLLEAWIQAAERGIEMPHMVCVGMHGWGVADLFSRHEANPTIQQQFHFLNDVTDDELSALYRDALFCVFPSYIEGWGLGATEALAQAKICVISSAPALVEATRGLMPSLDPDDVAAWIDIVHDLSTNPEKRKALEFVIRNEFRPKSWGKFASEFFAFAADGP
jgi:glycosyltransferase involved in cell wall biosynthesis